MYTDPTGHFYVPRGYSSKGVELGWVDETIYVDVKGTDVEGTLKENGSVIVNVAPLATALGGKVSWNKHAKVATIDINDKQVYYNADGYNIIGGHIQTDLKTSVDYFTNGGYNVNIKEYDSGSTTISVSKKNPISGFFTKAVDVIGGYEYAFPKAINMKANNIGTFVSDFYNDISNLVQSSEIAKKQMEAQLFCNSTSIMLYAQEATNAIANAGRWAASMDRVTNVFGASPSIRTNNNKGNSINSAPGSATFIRNKNDEFLINISLRTDVDPDGNFDAIAHGEPYKVQVQTKNGNVMVDHRVFAKLIQQSPGYKKGQNIRLLSCNTGKLEDGFAQNLANKLNVKVTAPTNYIWANEDGTTFVAGGKYIKVNGEDKLVPVHSEKGYMEVFSPWRNFNNEDK